MSDALTTRRRFLGLAGAAGATIAVGATTACSSTTGDAEEVPDGYPYRADRQAGVTASPGAAGFVGGFDLRVGSRAELRALFDDLDHSIDTVMAGRPFEVRDPGFPPVDTGILGAEPGPRATTVTVAVGASLFDERFGLSDRKPAELRAMPRFANDILVSEARSHGDLSITVSSSSQEAAVHAVRQVLRATRGRLVPRWSKEGFNLIDPAAGPGEAPGRNLMGFKDGTANPAGDDEGLMNDVVWVQPGDDEPDWAVGGTYQAVRVIRMMVEFWDRTRLSEQESIFGRHRDTGAPLGGVLETETPEFDDLESHIARANPRTEGSERNLILRRGFNYASGFDDNDQLDQGLLFVSYQRSLDAGFVTVQERLDGEVLEEYIRPLGGGFFFVLPGPGAGGEPLGASLLS